MKAEELVDALTDTVAKETVLIQKKTLGDMNAKTLVDASGDTLRKETTKTKDEKLKDIEAETLVEALAKRRTKDKGCDIKRLLNNVMGQISSRASG